MNKKEFKLRAGHCALCRNANYAVLDVHRIDEGKEYHPRNCIVLCANCHRTHHQGDLEILCKRMSSEGMVLIYRDKGEEKIVLLGR